MLPLMLIIAGAAFAQPAPVPYCGASSVVAAPDGSLQLARTWDTLFSEDFEAGLERWKVDNYENKLIIGIADSPAGGGCLQVSNRDATDDTAFEVTSQPIPVTAGEPFRFSFSYLSNRAFPNLVGHKGHYLSEVEWLDGAGDEVGVAPFAYPKARKSGTRAEVSGEIPAGAVTAVIRLGFDGPNVDRGDLLSFDDIRLESRSVAAPYERDGWARSRPLRVTGEARRLSWQAATPEGTRVTFQLSGARDVGGAPDAWSGFVGPDGTEASAFAEAGEVPAALAACDWLCYRASLQTDAAGQTPVLASVTVGDVTDGPWSGPDATPPVLSDRSLTRTADASAPVSFRLTDDTALDRSKLVLLLDGTDVSARLVQEGDRFTYTPPAPLEPPVAAPGFASWHVGNFQSALTIERTERRTPTSPVALHLTRESGNVDTCFDVQSPPIPVEPGAKYHFSLWTRHTVTATGPANSAGDRFASVIWLGAQDVPVGEPATLDLGPANPEWHEDTLDLVAPEGSLYALIRLGLDNPNIFDGGFVDLSEPALDGPHPKRDAHHPNLHRISLIARDFAGNSTERDWYLLIRAPLAEGVVTLRDDGLTLIDGKPFFPIGLYSVWRKPFNDNSFDKAFADMKAAGFNLAHTYASTRGAEFTEFYAAAARNGIKLYVSPNTGANTREVETVLADVVAEEARPALLAWYLADDTAGYLSGDELRTISDAVHDVDPAHPTVQADAVGGPPVSRYAPFVNSTDGFLPELYPIRNTGDKGVPQIIADMKTVTSDLAKAGTRQRTIWPIIQYFEGWGWPRFPTRDELWAMSYLSIIHGANGITWYTYGGSGANHGVTYSQEVWGNICALAGELSKLQDVLIERTGPQPPGAEVLAGPAQDALGYPSISILLKEHAGKHVLLAANSSAQEVTAHIRVAAGQEIALPFEGRRITAGADGFAETFTAYGVHVYEW